MTRVFFDVCTTLDGFMGPDARPDDADGSQFMKDWMAIVGWVFTQRFFRENLKLGDGGDTGQENKMLEETFHRTGTSVMGKRMFSAGEKGWPEDAPFHTPVFVLTHEKREPWERPGGTTFHFVNDGVPAALERAKEAAGSKDIRIAGGADVVRQFLNAGLVDEFTIHQAPTLLGRGVRLFEGIDTDRFSVELAESIHAPMVTHLRYRVNNRGPKV